MNKKRLVVIGLIIATLIISGAAVYIGIRISQQSTLPEETKAEPVALLQYTSFGCSGRCESGKECNQYGDPPVGYM